MIFKTLKNQEIFQDTYLDFNTNNELNFENKNIVVLYGPNGTGKTSLSKVLDQSPNCEYLVEINNETFTHSNRKIFHLIEDQNGRNIISGSTEDFILGNNIRREYELKKEIENKFNTLFNSKYAEGLKVRFKIATKNARQLGCVRDEFLKQLYQILPIQNQKVKM